MPWTGIRMRAIIPEYIGPGKRKGGEQDDRFGPEKGKKHKGGEQDDQLSYDRLRPLIERNVFYAWYYADKIEPVNGRLGHLTWAHAFNVLLKKGTEEDPFHVSCKLVLDHITYESVFPFYASTSYKPTQKWDYKNIPYGLHMVDSHLFSEHTRFGQDQNKRSIFDGPWKVVYFMHRSGNKITCIAVLPKNIISVTAGPIFHEEALNSAIDDETGWVDVETPSDL